jgi:hypothetical protein
MRAQSVKRTGTRKMAVPLQESKSAIFGGCNPLKYEGTILDKSVKNQFLQQNHGLCYTTP